MSRDMVHKGQEGWLFLVGGSNNVLDLYHRESSFTPSMVQAWVELIEARSENLSGLGMRYVHLPAPEKLTIMHRYFDGTLDAIEGSPIRQLLALQGRQPSNMVNPIDFLTRQSESLRLYWKTDTHWSPWGCFCAYQLLCNQLGVEPKRDLLQYPFTEGNALLDLSSKLAEPTREKVRYYNMVKDSKRVYANPLVRFKEEKGLSNEGNLHVGSHVIYRNESADASPERVVLFGDSFSEYRPQLLTGMLSETFREVHFIWNASIDYEYVQMVQADIVITELAERFMTQVPRDDLCVVTLAQKRLRDYRRNH